MTVLIRVKCNKMAKTYEVHGYVVPRSTVVRFAVLGLRTGVTDLHRFVQLIDLGGLLFE